MAFNLLETLKNDLEFCSVSQTARVVRELEAKDYSKVKHIINCLGGKWDKREQLFTFTKDPETLLGRAIEAGGRSINKYHLYPTPLVLTDFIRDYTGVRYLGCGTNKPIRVLEPSIGEGALMDALVEMGRLDGREFDVTGFEIDPLNAFIAQEKGYDVEVCDFLETEPTGDFQLILMNPPFQSDLYIKHIQHAQKFLAPRGKLISVVPTSWMKKSLTRSKASVWLEEQVMVDGTTSMNFGDFFAADTFKGVKMQTMVIEIGRADECSESRIAECRATSINDFALFVSTDCELSGERTSLIESVATGIDNANEKAAALVQKIMVQACKEGNWFSGRFVDDYERYVMGEEVTEVHCIRDAIDILAETQISTDIDCEAIDMPLIPIPVVGGNFDMFGS